MKKDRLLMLMRIVGIIVVIIGVFLKEWLPDDKEYMSLVLILIGIAINVASASQTKIVYVCPLCKTQFDMPKGKFVLTTGGHRNVNKAALLTCPCCKKTNWCTGKRIAKEEEK